jgi:hypothetical protein
LGTDDHEFVIFGKLRQKLRLFSGRKQNDAITARWSDLSLCLWDAAITRNLRFGAPLATRCPSPQEITMEKSRIVGVLRQARGLRKDKSGKTVISARLAARKKTTNSKWQNAPAQVTQALQKTSSQTVASEANRSESLSRQDVAREGTSPTSPE